jgi:RNA polymerase sigma factor (sigma-70 family)
MSAASVPDMVVSDRAWLLRQAGVYSRSADDAEDIVQDTIVRMLSSERRPCDLAAFRPWARKVMRNLCVDSVRRTARMRERLAQCHSNRPSLGTEEAALLVVDLGRAISALPPTNRRAFVRVVVSGETTSEVARDERRTRDTVRLRVRAAAAELRRVLEGDEVN